jgi:large subunit ribosomal protein L37e
MSKGTPSKGKMQKIVHIRCRRCGRHSYHVRLKRCSACGYPRSKIYKHSWKNKNTLGKQYRKPRKELHQKRKTVYDGRKI